MNRHEHYLSCLAEECSEVAVRVSKALRFGLNECQPGQMLNNRQRIEEELRDLIAVAEILAEEGVISVGFHPKALDPIAKRARIERFMAISREQGVLIE